MKWKCEVKSAETPFIMEQAGICINQYLNAECDRAKYIAVFVGICERRMLLG